MPADHDTTPRMELTVSDRVALDNRINVVKTEMSAVERHRIAPLEGSLLRFAQRQTLAITLAIVAICVAGASLVVQIARIIAIGPGR